MSHYGTFFFVSCVLQIATSRQTYFGEPIELSAKFTIDVRDKNSSRSQLNAQPDDMQAQKSFYSFKKTRPRPYLSEKGQIEFYEPGSALTKYKTTLRPAGGLPATKSTAVPITKATSSPFPSFINVPSTSLSPSKIYRPTFKPSVIVAEITNVKISTTTSAPLVSTTTAIGEFDQFAS